MTAKATEKSPFSKAFLDEMRSLLESEQEKLEKELAKFAHKNPQDDEDFEADFPEYGDEEDDNAHEVEQYTVNKPLEIVLEKKLRDVKKALERMGKGTYGMCKYTGKPIDERRLRARPTSSSSVEAKKLLTNEA